MKKLLAAIVCLALVNDCFAQISGKLISQSGQPILFANVLLLNPSDSSLIKGVITSDSGTFEIEKVEAGSYLLRFSAIGFKMFDTSAFTTAAGENKNLGTQTLEEDAQLLGEMTVKGEKPLYEQEIDRTVINVESSLMTKGSTALQVLERTPGVYVDLRNSTIALNGKSSVMVMLNGKLMRLPASQVVSMLSSMSANDIEKVELINTPPSKYDAEGTAGMINIVLKKRQDAGTTGTFSATTGYGWKEKGSASISLSHNIGKIAFYGSYAFLHDHGRDGWTALSTQNMPDFGGNLSVDVSSMQKININSHNATFGTDISLGKVTFGGSLTYTGSKVIRDILNQGTYKIIDSDSLLAMRASINGNNRWNNVISNVYFEKQLGQGGKLNVDLDYLSYSNESPTEAHTQFFDRFGNEAIPNGNIFSTRQKGISNAPIQVWIGKLDYSKQLSKKMKLETGIKSTFTTSSSLSRIENLVNGEWTGTARYTNDIDMKEKIGAAYTSLNIQVNPSLSLAAGLRYEYSYTKADADKAENNIDRPISKLFPSFFLSKKLNQQSEIQFSYTKRISRPSFGDLTSYLLYNDPMSVSTGNPSLRPTISNNFKLGYIYKGYSFSILAGRDNHPIVLNQQKESPAGDLMYLAPQNMAYQNNITFQASLPFTITNWWSMSYNAVGGFRQFKLDHTPEKLKKTYFAYTLNGSQTFTLPQQLSFEISGWLNSTSYEGSKKIERFGMLNAGVKKELKNNWGSIQLTVTDLLKSMRVSGRFGTLTEEAFSLKAHFIYKAESANYRIVKLTYSRSLGGNNGKARSSRSALSKDERDRIRKD